VRTSALLAFVLAACGASHAALQTPESYAPLPERLDAYARLRPVETSSAEFDYGPPLRTHRGDYVKLADGTVIDEAEDLLPLVNPDSGAADAVHDAERDTRVSHLLYAGAAIATVVGFLVAANAYHNGDDVWTPILVGLGAGAALGIPAVIENGEASADRRRAFQRLDDSMRARLHLCVAGVQIVECATPRP
jgi:hypothetical protein